MASTDGEGADGFSVVLVTAGEPGDAGMAVSIGKLLSALTATGGSVRLVTPCDPSLIPGAVPERVTRLPHHGTPFRRFVLGQADCAGAILALHRRRPIDLLVFAFGRDLALLPILVGRCAAHRVVLRSDGRPSLVLMRYIPGSSRIKRAVFRVMEETGYRVVDLLLTENQYMIRDNGFSQYPAVSPGPLYLDLDRFAPVTPYAERLFDLCFIGRLAEEKGIMDVVAALPDLLRAHPGFRMMIVGDGPCRGAVESAIEALDLSDSVTTTGWIGHDSLAGYLNRARLLVLPSEREGLPNIVLEAMACGTLVLARPVGGIPGVLLDGVTGYHIRGPGPGGIRDAVGRALGEGAQEACRARARALIEEEYSRRSVVALFRRLFRGLGLPVRADP